MADAPEWKFRRMQPGEMNIDPIEAEFFSTEALGSLADALVREAVQNSLDARRPGETLGVRVLFPAAEASLRGARRAAYLEGLAPHLRASRSGISAEALPGPEEPLSFVVIEDFGTRGLQGDPAQSEDDDRAEPAAASEDGEGAGPVAASEEGEGAEPVAGSEDGGCDASATRRNDFFFFWRNIGRSRKQAAELGRWGLGKTVFQAASRINSFFALTVRADDGRRLLLGQSVLRIHRLDGQRFYPYGYFGGFHGDFALPIDAEVELDRFARDFALARRNAPGLSVVLPYPDADLTPPAVVNSVLRHYFMPILAGELRVEVVRDRKIERLDAETLPRLFTAAAAGEDASLKRVFELARWSIGLPRAEHTRLAPPPASAAPRWHDECLDVRALAALRERFDAGRPTAVTVPVWVKPVGGQAVLATFDVYLERDDALERSDEHFVRDGITITGVRAGLPRGMRCIVTIRDRALSTLAGDSENPAHTEWQERSPKFRDRYRHGPSTLRYLRNAPRELARLLTQPAEGRDHALLKQLFSLELPTEAEISLRTADTDRPGTGETSDADAPATAGKDRLFALQKLRGGFRVKGLADAAGTPNGAAVWVAYETRRGNPFRQYQRLDFDLAKAPIEIEARRATVAACEGNVLVLRPREPDFELTVRGFDPHRDLRVRVAPAPEVAA
jgi:hypothetical protein